MKDHQLLREQALAVAQQQTLERAIAGAPLHEVLQPVVDSARELLAADCAAAVFILDPESSHPRFVATSGLDQRYVEFAEGSRGRLFPCARAAEGGEPVVLHDFEIDDQWTSLRPAMRSQGIRACWSYPVVAPQGDTVGAFAVYFPHPAPADHAATESLRALCRTAGFVIERHYEIERRHHLERLQEERDRLLEMLATGCTAQACLEELCGVIRRISPQARAVVLLTSEDRKHFAGTVGPDVDPLYGQSVKGAPINADAIGTCGEAVFRGYSVGCSDIEHDETWSQEWRELAVACGIRGCYSSPVKNAAGEAVAAFSVCFDEPRGPTKWEQKLAEFGAYIAGIALERERTYQELEEREQRYRALVTASSDVVYKMSPDWSEMRQLHGREFIPDQNEPSTSWLSKYIHPEDRPKVQEAVNHAVETGTVFELEHRVLRVDGSLGWTLSRAVPRFDSEGRIIEWMGLASDITERKQAEEALREQSKRLRHVTAELTTAEHRERKRLAAMLHDDLQQVVVALKMQLGRARSSIIDDTALGHLSRAEEMLEEVMATSKNLTRELRPPIVYDAGLMPALKALARDIESRYNLHVEADLVESEPPLSDNHRAVLFEGARELLINAAKHAGVGSARLESVIGSQQLRLIVADEGRGIDPEVVESPEQSHDRFGLMSIRERLIAVGCELALDSAPGRGTRIEMRAPFTETPGELIHERAGLSPETQGSGSTPAGIARVLVVDDHPVVRDGITRVLNEQDRLVVVGEAGDGEEAIDLVLKKQPDVVLMDVQMPRTNGIDATREIRRQAPEVAIIGLSVQDDSSVAELMTEAGAVAFLPKSGNSEQLVATILDAVHP